MLLRIIYDALDLNSHFKLFQLFSRRGFGLDRRPHRNIDHSLRDRCRNFGLPACEGVAGAGRGAVERGGRGILPKVRIDLIGENLFTIYAVGVGDGVYLRHMYAALRLELPAVPGPDQRDRNDLLIVLDMFQVLERRVELGHIAFGVIADVAKPVVPFLPRLEDEVVYIALAEQTVGGRMLLRSIYDALDLNSHFKLFQLVSRRGFGLADDFNDRQVTLLLPFPVLVTSCFGVIAEGDGQRCVLLVNEPVLDAGGGVICHQIRRYRDRRGDVVALLVLLHIADRILRRGGNIIRLVRMCCFVVLADDSKTAVQRRGLFGRGHFVRGFDPRVRCRFHPRLTIFIIGEVERDGLRGRGVLHLPDQIAGLLHEPCRPDSHRADISARAIAYDLADRMLCVGRVSERILYRIMRSGCRNADNIYNNAGHVVFRGLVGLIGGWGLLAVLNLDHTQAVVQLPRVILVADYKLQRCLVRIVELMRLRFFAVVLCDIRRGLDGHVVFPRLIQSRRFRPVERLALRVVDQVVVFRPAAGRADVLYLNLPDSRFQIVIGGNRNRIAPFPNGVDGLGAVFMFNVNRVARLILRSGRSRTVSPALEGVAFLARGLIGDGKGNPVHRWMRCRTRLTSRRTGAAIRIILQFKEWHPDGIDGLLRIVLGQYDRISARVLRSHSIRLVRPANVLIATAGQLRSINIKREGGRRRGPIRHFREPRTVRAVVILIIQIVHVGRSGVGFLRDQINRIRCLRSSRTGGVEVKNCGVLLGLFRPANEFIARIQLAFQRRNADISELADQNRMIEARMACAILACIGLINRRAIVIANVELIADIKNLVLDCLCFIRFQRLRTDTVVSRKGRHRQHAEHHNQN